MLLNQFSSTFYVLRSWWVTSQTGVKQNELNAITLAIVQQTPRQSIQSSFYSAQVIDLFWYPFMSILFFLNTSGFCSKCPNQPPVRPFFLVLSRKSLKLAINLLCKMSSRYRSEIRDSKIFTKPKSIVLIKQIDSHLLSLCTYCRSFFFRLKCDFELTQDKFWKYSIHRMGRICLLNFSCFEKVHLWTVFWSKWRNGTVCSRIKISTISDEH